MIENIVWSIAGTIISCAIAYWFVSLFVDIDSFFKWCKEMIEYRIKKRPRKM